jgi:hypothetical protein
MKAFQGVLKVRIKRSEDGWYRDVKPTHTRRIMVQGG